MSSCVEEKGSVANWYHKTKLGEGISGHVFLLTRSESKDATPSSSDLVRLPSDKKFLVMKQSLPERRDKEWQNEFALLRYIATLGPEVKDYCVLLADDVYTGYDEAGNFKFFFDYLGPEYVDLFDFIKLSSVTFSRHLESTWALIYNVVRDLLRGVHVLHDAGIIHFDIKPENIMVHCSTGRVKFIDFGRSWYLSAQPTHGASTTDAAAGTAASTADAAVASSASSAAGTVAVPAQQTIAEMPLDRRGSTYYYAPELYKEATHPRSHTDKEVYSIGVTADLWSLGQTIFSLCSGFLLLESNYFRNWLWTACGIASLQGWWRVAYHSECPLQPPLYALFRETRLASLFLRSGRVQTTDAYPAPTCATLTPRAENCRRSLAGRRRRYSR